MNRTQKAVAAVMALTITLVGATAVTAPIAFADVQSPGFHQALSVPGTQPNSPTVTSSLRHV
ncbi:MAG: hypothetical protein ACYDAE_02975 [Steroidobacteraceae bacterium]